MLNLEKVYGFYSELIRLLLMRITLKERDSQSASGDYGAGGVRGWMS